ncbi:DUF4112 domain-containing protein [Roseovarius sp. C7]|uniref:DUF4112 domain-containing protein n=1 Tax=Roseovarius sp. C7 TaxID=3398643 RepID=UPI0039F58DB0
MTATTPTETPRRAELDAELDRLDRLARRMDRAFRLPFTQIRFGWDALLGLVPGVGDTAALAPSVYILARAHKLGAPGWLLLRMATNLGVDWAVGLIPLIGDLLDIGIKANTRNVHLLRAHMQKAAPEGPPSMSSGTGRKA